MVRKKYLTLFLCEHWHNSFTYAAAYSYTIEKEIKTKNEREEKMI